MYFTYEKTVRFASNGNYDTRKLFDFIVDLFSIEDIQDMIDDGYNNPRSVVYSILYQSNLGECIINTFLLDEDSDFINNIDDEDVEKQIASNLEDQLINYYTEHWKDFNVNNKKLSNE